MNTITEGVTEKLFQEVKEENEKFGELSDHLLSALNCVFGHPLLSALDLVDCCAVTRITTPDQKEVYQVASNSGRIYTCPASLQFCPCLSFSFGVIKRGELLMCKHILAIHLCKALGACKEVEKTDQEFSVILYQQEY